ncbi:MAG: hypothetical protein KatS3mg102_1252 [Planctomycetota bacterium]|nr:MAG: hypothetical protein KatS3mg102_1252 [Planctomycetota bacterium]
MLLIEQNDQWEVRQRYFGQASTAALYGAAEPASAALLPASVELAA